MTPHSKPHIDEDEIEAALSVLKSGNIAVGPEIERFEKSMAKYIGSKHAVAVNNGTAALHMALMALGVSSGDEVIIPASVCPALLHAIEYTGASPIICDVNEHDLNLNYDSAKQAITSSTKAIILPHMFGMPSDIERFQSLEIPLIEDCAQSLGSEYKGKKLGSFGALSTYSFYATKVMTSIDGGMILTNDDKMAMYMRDIRYYGGKRDYTKRYNYKLQNLNAVIGITQLKKLDSFLLEREKQFNTLLNALDKIEGAHVLTTENDVGKTFYYKLLIHFTSHFVRDRYLELCNDCDISTSRSIFVDLDSFYRSENEVRLKNMIKHIDNTYSFPIYPNINQEAVNQFINRVPKIFLSSR